MFRVFIRQIIYATLITFASAQTFAAPNDFQPHKRLWCNRSADDFRQALRIQVASVPGLRNAWTHIEQLYGARPGFYLSGGVLRGLIHKLYVRCAENPAVPLATPLGLGISALFLQTWSDVDFVALNPERSTVKGILETTTGHTHWDVLTESFMRDSTRAGGAALDKVQVSPWDVRDPYGAIDAYLEGNLDFVDPKQTSVGLIVGNSKLALALRLLRLQKNLPEVRITAQGREVMKNLINEDWNAIRHESNKSDYWVKKALLKYLHACNMDPLAFLDGLHEYQVLPALARNHFSLPMHGELPANPPLLNISADWWRYFVQTRYGLWPLESMLDAAEVMAAYPEWRREFSKILLHFYPKHEQQLEIQMRLIQTKHCGQALARP